MAAAAMAAAAAAAVAPAAEGKASAWAVETFPALDLLYFLSVPSPPPHPPRTPHTMTSRQQGAGGNWGKRSREVFYIFKFLTGTRDSPSNPSYKKV